MCKVPFKLFSSKDSKKTLEWRDLTSPEKHHLFMQIKISELFPELSNKEVIQSLWEKFYEMYLLMNTEKPDSDLLKTEAQAWVTTYLTVYQTKNIIPYIHAFTMHVHKFIRLYESLQPYSQQALEKLNDLTTLHYMRATNHHHKNEEALCQLLIKRNWIDSLENMEGVN